MELGIDFEGPEEDIPFESVTPEDRAKLISSYARRNDPGEHHVFAIARKWSIDPTQIEEYDAAESPGLLGYLAQSSER